MIHLNLIESLFNELIMERNIMNIRETLKDKRE